jgi:hypothetical protein
LVVASTKDHLRRDAEHRVRLETSGLIGQYQRRILEAAYAYLGSKIADAQPGTELEGRQLGIEAFESAASSFLAAGASVPQEAIEVGADSHSEE